MMVVLAPGPVPTTEEKPSRHSAGLELEAAPGFEPGIRDLQSRALPLGYAATGEVTTPNRDGWVGNARLAPRQFSGIGARLPRTRPDRKLQRRQGCQALLQAQARSPGSLFDRVEQLRLGRLEETSGEAPGHGVALDRAEQSAIGGSRPKGADIDRFAASVREHHLAGGGVEAPHEKARFLDIDLPPKVSELDDVHPLSGQKPNRAIEGGPQTRMGHRLTLVGPVAIAVQYQSERLQRRRVGRGSGFLGSGQDFVPNDSGSADPSGLIRKTPTRS